MSMQIHRAQHLSRAQRIQTGGYYTPKALVDEVFNYIRPYLLNHAGHAVLFDNAAGCGAFVNSLKNYDYRAADVDIKACEFLKQNLNPKNIFCGNSLENISREKYKINRSAFLIMLGNPPYNDTTSEFRSGQKGKNFCDNDLLDRDLGVSFLKSYDKLEADAVCVLHPLSYLIKKANFNRLGRFSNNYRLKKACLFSSGWFSETGLFKFPIMIGLYEKNKEGMDYEYIRNFEFDVLGLPYVFKLSSFKTTDGIIHKYPNKIYEPVASPLNLYFYTFRDINSLKRNRSFMDQAHYNAIVVNLGNFYKYAYLLAFKNLFQPKESWLYGNLSPLVNEQSLEKNKKWFMQYALAASPSLQNMPIQKKQQICNFYQMEPAAPIELASLIDKIRQELKSLELQPESKLKQPTTKLIKTGLNLSFNF